VGGAGIALVALIVSVAVVAVRLHLTRVELARSFLDRAYRAQRDGDATLAAGYFAASRAQHDTLEARWGLAVARERQVERVLARTASAGSFLDVTRLADGRVVTFGRAGDQVEVREVESGALVWSAPPGGFFRASFVPGGLLRVRGSSETIVYDAATGEVRERLAESSGLPCAGPFPASVFAFGSRLFEGGGGPSGRVIATDLFEDACAVSDDRQRLAYSDASGVVRVLRVADGKELARQAGGFVVGLHFSPHGVVVVRLGRVDVLGDEDTFSVGLPDDRRSAYISGAERGGASMSRDGQLVAFASSNGSRTVVVDLKSRTIRAVLHHAAGWPRLAFSADGSRIFAAGLGNGAYLNGWRLPSSDLPGTARWWTNGILSQGGRSSLLLNHITGRYELERPVGTVTARGTRPMGLVPLLIGDGPLVSFFAAESGSQVLLDLEQDKVLWQRRCRLCWGQSASADGSVLATAGADGVEVWDVRGSRQLFREPRIDPQSDLQISRDGRLLAYSDVERVVVRELESGRERSFAVDSAVRGLSLGPDGRSLVVVSAGGTRLEDLDSGRTRWTFPGDVAEGLYIRWSFDARSVLVTRAWVATEVFDARTGERQALFQCPGRPVSPVVAELYSPDLRVKAATSETTWDFRPIPPPDGSRPEESLARTLRETGLALRGGELVAAP
jgi:WD40 repeat protein